MLQIQQFIFYIRFILSVLVYESDHYGRIFGPSGLILNVNNMFFSHILVNFTIQLIDPINILHKYLQRNEREKGAWSLLT